MFRFMPNVGQVYISIVLLLCSLQAEAHIVPAEEFHPMAESYRRIAFMVNLNPVLWDQVEQDSHVIAKELVKVDKQASTNYLKTTQPFFEALREKGGVPGTEMRQSSAKAVLEFSTQAVVEGFEAHLELAAQSIGNNEEATTHLEIARKIFSAFEHEIKWSDAEMYPKLGQAWLQAFSSLGTSGILGVGQVPADIEMYRLAQAVLVGYVSQNYGEGYSLDKTTWMRPVPYRSASYDPNARIPVKLAPGSNLNKQLPRPRQILNMAERGVSEMETPLIALGDMAFDSPYIFGGPAQEINLSCNTCHNKGTTNPNFAVAGLTVHAGSLDASNNFFAPPANNGHFDPVDIPDLRGIRFTAPYGRNGRMTSLREFVRNVIMNEFGGPEPDPVMMDAIIAYMNEFDFLPNVNLDRFGKLTDTAPEGAKRGEVLFHKPFAQMDKKSCASCHIPSNHFLDGQQHTLGYGSEVGSYTLDHAMDTPTLLSVLHTPPYMHDGSLATLNDVVKWFNTEFTLDLDESEVADLTEYLSVIGDGEEAFEDTLFTLEAEMEEFSFFLNSYEYVKSIGKLEMASTIFQTISTEINAHKWDIQDDSHMPTLNKMARLMEEAYAANEADDTETVDALVAQYFALYEQHADVLK